MIKIYDENDLWLHVVMKWLKYTMKMICDGIEMSNILQ